MANKEHVEKFRRGVEAWNTWREANPDVTPHLSGEDLREEPVKAWNASRWEHPDLAPNFEDADLSRAKLSRANLSRAKLSRADLSGADLWGANLSGAKLGFADLSGAKLWSANLSGAEFWSANLSGADLERANLNGAYLMGADLSGAQLLGADLGKANLSSANLRLTDLRDADLSDADVAGVKYARKAMRGKYRGIRGIESCHGDAIFKRDAADQDFIDTLEARWRTKPGQPEVSRSARGDEGDRVSIGPREAAWRARLTPPEAAFAAWDMRGQWAVYLSRWIFLWLWRRFDYGRCLWCVGAFGLGVALVFGLVYKLVPGLLDYTGSAHTGWTPFYYSIVTYTTLGFGDVTPRTLAGEILVTVEVIFGYVTLGLLLAILARKVARLA